MEKFSRRSFLQLAAGAPVAVALSAYSPIVPARTVKLPVPAFIVNEVPRWTAVNVPLPNDILIRGVFAGGYVLDFSDYGLYVGQRSECFANLHREDDSVQVVINSHVMVNIPLNGQMECTVCYERVKTDDFVNYSYQRVVKIFDLYGPRNLQTTVKG